jgi:ATP-binding cassette subfamily C protein
VLGKREKYIDGIYKARVSTANSAATQHYLSGMPRYIIEASLLVGIALFVSAQALSGDIVKSAATIGVFLSGGFRLTAAMLPLQSSLLAINGALAPAKTAHDSLDVSKRNRVSHSLPATGRIEDSSLFDKASVTFPIGVRMDNVSFFYPDSNQPALTNTSLVIEPGAQVALMGPSGAGKSTIADLLCTVLTPSTGSITRTDQSGVTTDPVEPGRVSYVPQKPGLVSGTILENIALAEDPANVDRAKALEALRLAHLSNLINELPEGLDTPLGKLQDGLSGGQIQRLGLARALYTQPGLLVMDEATSALDGESEAEIQKALDAMRGRVTVVLIAHRLNTIQHADKVILVEDGKVKDSGTFKELIARNPSVERLVDMMNVDKD